MQRSSAHRAFVLALVSTCVALAGCRDLLGIGDENGASVEDGGDASVTDGAASATDGDVVRGDASAAKLDGASSDAASSGDASLDGGADASPLDARYAAWKLAPDSPTALTTTTGGAVVVDGLTGLWWEQANAFAPSSLSNAASYCAGLSLAGDHDWRVPTRAELLSIVDYDAPIRRPAIFGAPGAQLWTQSRLIGDVTQVYLVGFVNDATSELVDHADPGGTNGVRCVRNGLPLPASPSAPLPAGLWVASGNYVQNTRTGLLWEKSPPTLPLDYATAASHCASLSGGTFRIPIARELDTLTDESRTATPVWPAVFDGTPGEYWSSTAYDSNNKFTWRSTGVFGLEQTDVLDVYVRCVSP